MGGERRPAFELSKWYLDAVGESGEVFIGYRADVAWRSLYAAYASALTGGDTREPRTRSTVRPEGEPGFLEGALSWESQRLGVAATWSGAPQQPLLRTLYESPDGAVVWRCLMPSASASIAFEGRLLSGLGYVERLSMTVPPWRLPLDVLRWGRFLTPAHSVVWIDWREDHERDGWTWIFVDGLEVRGETSDEAVLFEGGRVDLPAAGRLVLRDGRLSHLLRSLPRALRASLPGRALSIVETKWRTRGCLSLDRCPPAAGWAIHETVRFR